MRMCYTPKRHVSHGKASFCSFPNLPKPRECRIGNGNCVRTAAKRGHYKVSNRSPWQTEWRATQLRSILVVKTEVWLFPPRWDCCAAPANNNFSRNGTATARRDGGGEFYVDGVAMQFCQRKWQQLENLSSIKKQT